MILDPGSLGGKLNSPNPQRGPLPNNRISFAILLRLAARVLNAPLTSTMESCAASASKRFGADVNGRPVYSAMLWAMAVAYPSVVLSPVPLMFEVNN